MVKVRRWSGTPASGLKKNDKLDSSWAMVWKQSLHQRTELVAVNLCCNTSLTSEHKTGIHLWRDFAILEPQEMSKNEGLGQK